MSLNGILTSALSSLQTNSAALRVVANNIANVNTPNYARRVVNLEAQATAGQLAGVEIVNVQRVADQYLNQEVLLASAAASRYDTQSTIFDQISTALGTPGDGNALTSKLSNVFTTLGQVALSPTASVSQNAVVNSMRDLAGSISSLSDSMAELQGQADSQVVTAVTTADSLIKQVYDLNQQIKTAYANGDSSSALLDQQDTALHNLSQLMDIQSVERQDGTVVVTTQDGVALVGDYYAKLSYRGGGSSGMYQPIAVQTVNPLTGVAVGQAQDLDPHLGGGSIRGLLDMRDDTLGDLRNQLGSLAQGVALSFNARHNANSAYPPPTTMEGRDTGLLGTDALNFTGKTTIAVTGSTGTLVSRVDVDFDAGTLSVDGGGATAFGGTIDGFVSALNSALGSNGSASFSDGALDLSAADTNGVVIQDDATAPASRGGSGFSQFFGLNDLFGASAPSILSTGLSAGDDAGLSAGEQIGLELKGPNSQVAWKGTVTISGGETIGDVINAMNTAMGGYASFTLNADGSVTTATATGHPGYQLQVTSDSTERGTTGMGFTALFGIGANQMGQQAAGFSLAPAIDTDSSRLGTAIADFSGTQIVGSGDSSGLLALQNLATQSRTFAAVGNLGRQVSSLNNYAGAFYQDVATRASNAQTSQTTQDDRLTEAQSRQSSQSGVSLDEELSNMMIYQRAYSAGARMLSAVDQIYQTLLAMQ